MLQTCNMHLCSKLCKKFWCLFSADLSQRWSQAQIQSNVSWKGLAADMEWPNIEQREFTKCLEMVFMDVNRTPYRSCSLSELAVRGIFHRVHEHLFRITQEFLRRDQQSATGPDLKHVARPEMKCVTDFWEKKRKEKGDRIRGLKSFRSRRLFWKSRGCWPSHWSTEMHFPGIWSKISSFRRKFCDFFFDNFVLKRVELF